MFRDFFRSRQTKKMRLHIAIVLKNRRLRPVLRIPLDKRADFCYNLYGFTVKNEKMFAYMVNTTMRRACAVARRRRCLDGFQKYGIGIVRANLNQERACVSCVQKGVRGAAKE